MLMTQVGTKAKAVTPTPAVNNLTWLLKHVLYIYYQVHFKRDQANVQALLNFSSGINAMSSIYTAKLGLKIRLTNIKAQKVNGSMVETFKMVLASF